MDSNWVVRSSISSPVRAEVGMGRKSPAAMRRAARARSRNRRVARTAVRPMRAAGSRAAPSRGMSTRAPGPLKASRAAVQGRSTTSRQPVVPRGAKPVMRWVPMSGPRRRAPAAAWKSGSPGSPEDVTERPTWSRSWW